MCCCSKQRARALTKGSSIAASARFSQSYTSPMDADCPTANVQPTLEDGATPSHCATDARERTLARDRARRRERLASETAWHSPGPSAHSADAKWRELIHCITRVFSTAVL